MAKKQIVKSPKVTSIKVGDTVVVTEVFQVSAGDRKMMSKDPCIDNCNAVCSAILVGDSCWGDPSGHQVAGFYKKNVA